MASFPNLTTHQGVKHLDNFLENKSYISGYVATKDDLEVYMVLSKSPEAKEFPHAHRWWKHINALIQMSFPGDAQGVKIEGAQAGAASQPVVTDAVASKEVPEELAAEDDDMGKDVLADDDDEDLDLFGEMTEEEKKAQEEKKAAIAAKMKKAAEKNKLSKSMIIMDVKPWDDTTDLGEMEKFVRSIHHDGLLWGQSKLVPVGFGIRKLQITAVIEDAKIESMDIIIEDEIVKDGENEFIQSVDVVSFNRI